MVSIYINSLSYALNNLKVNLYADDTAITITGNNPRELNMTLSRTMETLVNWFQCNRLSLYVDKPKLMLFGTKSQQHQMNAITATCGSFELERVRSYKYLRMKLDAQLNFSEHAQYIKSKTLGKIAVLGRMKNFVDYETSLMLYKTLILPLFNYCDVVYNCLN